MGGGPAVTPGHVLNEEVLVESRRLYAFGFGFYYKTNLTNKTNYFYFIPTFFKYVSRIIILG